MVLGFVLTVLSTTLFAWWSVGAVKLQPVVVMIVSAGFRLPLLSGGAVAVLLGFMSDLVSGGVVGLQLFAYLLVLCLCAVAQRKLEINSWPFQMLAVGLMSLVTQVAMTGGQVLVNRGQTLPLVMPLLMIIQALFSALTAPMLFGLLQGLVRLIEHFWPSSTQAGA